MHANKLKYIKSLEMLKLSTNLKRYFLNFLLIFLRIIFKHYEVDANTCRSGFYEIMQGSKFGFKIEEKFFSLCL